MIPRFVGYHYDGLQPGVHTGLPSTLMTLVLPLDGPLEVTIGGERDSYGALLSGLHTDAARIHHGTAQIGLQLDIHPLACRALFGMPAGELVGIAVELAQVWGPLAQRTLDAAYGADTITESCAVVAELLRPREAIAVRREVVNAWRLIVRSGGRMTVEAIAEAVGWSRRNLEQRFREEVGVTPKQACRLRRFELAVEMVRGEHSLAEAASVAGFADQPHLTREWRALTGQTPTQWQREDTLAFIQDAATALRHAGQHD